jgi:hypothetical protein
MRPSPTALVAGDAGSEGDGTGAATSVAGAADTSGEAAGAWPNAGAVSVSITATTLVASAAMTNARVVRDRDGIY